MAENRGAAHAVQRFEDHVTVQGSKFTQHVGAAADHGWRRALGELGGEQFFVTVAQALRFVDDQYAIALGLFQQVGGVHKLHVEGRVLAHQDHVQIAQGRVGLGVQLKPLLRVGEHLQRLHAGPGLAFIQVKVLLLHVEQGPATVLGCQQHGQRAVLFIGDARNGVHDNPDSNAHGKFLK